MVQRSMSEQSGDWREYSRLVLTELERHNDLLLKIHEKLDTIRLQQALADQVTKDLAQDQLDLTDKVSELDKRIMSLETGSFAKEEVTKYKRIVISSIVIAFSSFIFPVIQIILRLTGNN